MDDLFTGDVTEPSLDPTKDYTQELVGEGKKFKDHAALAYGKMQSDSYIKTLERQLDSLRTDYLKERQENTTRARLEELIDKLSQKPTDEPVQPATNTSQQSSIDFDSLFSRKIQEHELTKKQMENFNQVRTKLRESLGPNYQDHLRQTIDALGLTDDDVNALARKSPSAFFKTMGLDTKPSTESFQPPPRTSTTTPFKPTRPEKRTWSWYQNLKKTDPTTYYSPKTNIQMHDDAIALGAEFQDGDFNAM